MINAEWTYENIPDFYVRVRGLLDNVSDVTLPDTYIDMPEKAPYAEAYAKGTIKQWTTLTEEQERLFESAIVYKTASFFESTLSSHAVKRKELPTIKLEYFPNTALQKDNMSLSEYADYLLAQILGKKQEGYFGFMVT